MRGDVMSRGDDNASIGRREFMKRSAVAAVSGSALAGASGPGTKELSEGDEVRIRNERPTMAYQRLRRTDIISSRLVFGCGAALAGGKGVRLLDRAFEAGINHFDVGSNISYKGSEKSLAPFMKAHRNDLWVLSKAPARINAKPNETITVDQAMGAAKSWLQLLDGSLKDLDSDFVDAYYLMAVNNPSLVRSEEMYKAFQSAKAAGKVGYFGVSTHQNAQNVLEAAIETGWYDIAMIGITPGGWYDWDKKALADDTPTLLELQPLLKRARDAGIGLVGLKAARYLAPKATANGSHDSTAFNQYYDELLLKSPLGPFQRSYAYVLGHGIDVVNSHMQNFQHLEQNIVAAATSHKYFS